MDGAYDPRLTAGSFAGHHPLRHPLTDPHASALTTGTDLLPKDLRAPQS